MARSIRPDTSGVGSVRVLQTPKGSASDEPSQTAFDLERKGSNLLADCGNVSSRHQNCQHRQLVHQAYQPAGLIPGQGPVFPLLSRHQQQSWLNPGMPPRKPEPKTEQHSHSSDGSSQYLPSALSFKESRKMTDLDRSGLIDKRNTETVQRIRVKPQRRVILPRQELNSKVIAADVFPSWQKLKSVQSAALPGIREFSPHKTIVLQPEAGITFRVSGLRRSKATVQNCLMKLHFDFDSNFRSFWCQSPSASPSNCKTSNEDFASIPPGFQATEQHQQ